MVPGFNTDFKYRGETYHVQTEDNGVGNPVVVSLLYHKGAILASRRTPYHELVDKSGFEKELMALMKTQHKDLMRSLLAGAFDKDGTAPAAAGGSGAHPADAAAAVANSMATPTPAVPPSLRVSPPPPPSIPVQPLKPLIERAPSTVPRPAPATAESALTGAQRPAVVTLDEEIRHYLEEFAATAAASVH